MYCFCDEYNSGKIFREAKRAGMFIHLYVHTQGVCLPVWYPVKKPKEWIIYFEGYFQTHPGSFFLSTFFSLWLFNSFFNNFDNFSLGLPANCLPYSVVPKTNVQPVIKQSTHWRRFAMLFHISKRYYQDDKRITLFQLKFPNRWLWKENVTTSHASSVLMEVVPLHIHLMLHLMGSSTASTILLSSSWRKETTAMSSRLLLWEKMARRQPYRSQKTQNQMQPTNHKSNLKQQSISEIYFHAISLNGTILIFLKM